MIEWEGERERDKVVEREWGRWREGVMYLHELYVLLEGYAGQMTQLSLYPVQRSAGHRHRQPCERALMFHGSMAMSGGGMARVPVGWVPPRGLYVCEDEWPPPGGCDGLGQADPLPTLLLHSPLRIPLRAPKTVGVREREHVLLYIIVFSCRKMQ